MKNVIYILSVFIISAIFFAGCSEEIHNESYRPSLKSLYLDVSPRNFTYGSGEEDVKGSVEADGAWSLSGIPEWLKASPSSGNRGMEFNLSSSLNASLVNREAVFYIKLDDTSEKIQRTLTASQIGATPYIKLLRLDSSTIEMDANETSLIIEVETNVADLSSSFSQSWGSCVYDNSTHSVKVTLQPNETDFSRTGKMELSSKEYSVNQTLTIIQHASNIKVLEGEDLIFEADGGDQIRTISSTLSWTAQPTNSWIDIFPKSGGSGISQVKISAAPSYEAGERVGHVYFYFGESERAYVRISQAGRFINLSESSIAFNADGGVAQVNVDANIGWNATAYPDWIESITKEGNIAKISAAKNNSLNPRSGTIVISDSETGGIEARLNVVQNGVLFDYKQTLEFGWQASEQIFQIGLPGSWEASVSDEWISLSEYFGKGECDLGVAVERNDGEQLRSGTITFASEGNVFNVNVVQTGQYLKVETTSGEIPAAGGKIQIDVYTSMNLSYKIVTDVTDDFINVQPTEDGYLLDVAPSPSSLQRKASFVVYSADENALDNYIQGIEFKITQFGRGLSCETSKIAMFSEGGTSQTYKISADGKYSIKKDTDDSWYSLIVDYDNDNFYLIVDENKSSVDRIGHVIIALEDLPQGEEKTLLIEVSQPQYKSNIEVDKFDEDENWNL